jgi:fumarylpyruvate hydrolase
MAYAVPVFELPTLPVMGSAEVFPVRRIYAIGRNYAAHAAETGLGGKDGPTPGISLKPADSVVPGGGAVAYPPGTRHLEPEIEMVVAIGRGGADIPPERAREHVFGYAVGFDLIRRDILQECIRNQHSWDLCKSFDGASPISALRRADAANHPRRGTITASVNGVLRQRGDLADMVWDVAEIVSRLSRYSRLAPGDLVFTGTPKGPAPVGRGDVLLGVIEGVGELEVRIV